jgi:hypothetical protein
MTLAPETSKVSWVCMGLRRVPILAEVSTLPSKSQDSSSGLEVVGLEVKPHGASPAISRHASSQTDPAGNRHTAASWYAAPRNLCHFGF